MSPTILIVEDNAVTRQMIRVALERESYSVPEAGDAETALGLMTRHRPDLVLQDLALPDIDGFELVQSLRGLPHAAGTPVLAFSEFLSPEEQFRSVQAGFTDYVCKPIQPSQLVCTVRAYLLPAGSKVRNEPAGGETPGRGRRILVADEDPIQLKLLTIQLMQLGFQVTTAADGADALDQARRSRPDAIVSGVLMPRLDGFCLCQAVRQDPRLARVPVVLASASQVEEEDRRLARTVGANALVLRTPELQNVTEALLAGLSEAPRVEPRNSPLSGDSSPSLGAPVGGQRRSQESTRRAVRQLEHQVDLNLSLSERLAWLEAKFAILTGIAETLKNSSSFETVVDELLHHCLSTVGVDRGIVYLLQPDGRLSLRVQLGYRGAAEVELSEFFGHSHLLHAVMAAGEPVSGHRSAATHGAVVPEELLARAAAQSMFLTPLVLGAERLGVLVIAAANRKMSDEWVPFARLVGSQIGQAIGLARAFCQIKENEAEKKRFYREVIRAVTHDRLYLVDAGEIPAEGRFVLEMPCEDPADCYKLREQLQGVAESVGMRAEVIDDWILAAGEAAANAVKHAVAGRCAVSVASDRVIARVSDHGKGIRLEDLPASLLLPGFSTQISLGMGYTLMLKLVERIWLATGPEGTVAQIEKWFDPEQLLASRLLGTWE